MISSLVKKEIRLQRGNILFALVVFLVWALDFLLVLTGNRPLSSRFITTGTLAQIVHYTFVLPCLLVIFPILVGATTVAQERKMGLLDWQISLPPSRSLQWIVKTGVALFLALFLGGALFWILDRVIVWNLGIHDMSWMWGEKNIVPVPLRFKGLWPGIFPILFFSMGMYLSSISREPYRALMASFGFLGLSFFAQRLIDPAGMLVPLGKTFPVNFIHHYIYYFQIASLSLFLLGMGFINFRTHRSKKIQIILQILIWVFAINITGYFTLRTEFRAERTLDERPVRTPGLSKLLGSRDLRFSSPVYRIPGSPRIVTTITTDRDKLRFSEDAEFGWCGHIIEINVETEKRRGIFSLFGQIEEMDPKGRYYSVEQALEKHTYHVRKSGIVISANMDRKLQKILGASPEPLVSLEPSIYYKGGGPVRKMILKTPDGDIVYPDFNTYPWEKYGDIETYSKCLEKEGKFITLLVRRTKYPDTFELIDKKKGFFGPGAFPLSTDGKWYARNRWDYPKEWNEWISRQESSSSREIGIQIINTDRTTSYTIQPDEKFIVLCSDWDYYIWGILQISNERARMINLSLSPDGRYLFFIRFPSNSIELYGEPFPDGFPMEMEFWLLDLKSGKEILLEKAPPSLLSYKKREAFLEELKGLKKFNPFKKEAKKYITGSRSREISMLPTAWSKDNKFAILYDEILYVYRYLPQENRFLRLGSVNIIDTLYDRLFRVEYRFNGMIAFWSNDTLLIMSLSYGSLWKLDLTSLEEQH